jgi:hypothetical protein
MLGLILHLFRNMEADLSTCFPGLIVNTKIIVAFRCSKLLIEIYAVDICPWKFYNNVTITI